MSSHRPSEWRNARHVPEMPQMPNPSDLEAVWQYMEAGLNRIIFEPTWGMDIQSLIALYTTVHNFCTSKNIVEGSAYHLLGEDLYRSLDTYLSQYLDMLKQRLKSLHGQSLLDCYLWEYSQFTNTAQIIHYIFRYLNRHWIRRQIDEGWLVYDIYTPHLVRWHSIIFQDISCDLVSAISELVEKHNDGQVIEHGDGKDLIEFIVSLALDATNPPYGSILEIPLRKSIMAASENNRLLEFFYEDSVPNYDDESARTEMEDQLVALTLGSQARARARNNDGMVKLVTSDLAVVEVEQKSAECSFIIKHLCAYFGRDIIDREFITLPNVDEAILRKILKWCDYHKDDADSSLVNRNTDTPIDIDEWDRSYMQVDQKTLFKIVLAANFLDIEALVALGCQTIAELINGRSSDEIRKTFGLPNDFTPEEEEQLRREAAWTEESEETYLPTLPRRVAH